MAEHDSGYTWQNPIAKENARHRAVSIDSYHNYSYSYLASVVNEGWKLICSKCRSALPLNNQHSERYIPICRRCS